MWHKDCFCGILVKNVATFCPCLKSLPKAKVKRLRLIAFETFKNAQQRLCSLVKTYEQKFEQAQQASKETSLHGLCISSCFLVCLSSSPDFLWL